MLRLAYFPSVWGWSVWMCEVHRIALRVSPSLGDDRKISPFCGRRLRYFPSVWGLSVTRRKPEDSCGAFPQRLGIDGAQPHHWTVWRISPVSGDDRIDSAISHPSGKYFPSVWGWSACSPAAAVPKNVFPQRLGIVGPWFCVHQQSKRFPQRLGIPVCCWLSHRQLMWVPQ